MTDSTDKDDHGYVFHWPELGIENGEFVGFGEDHDDVGENPFVVRIIAIAGFLSTLVKIFFVSGLVVVGLILVDRSVGITAVGSIEEMILLLAALIILVDEVVDRIAESPIRVATVLLAVVAILPPALLLSLHRSDRSIGSVSELVDVLRESDVSVRALISEVLSNSSGALRADGGERKVVDEME